MRSSSLVHGIWLVVAVAAFAVGKMQSSSSREADANSEAPNKSGFRSGGTADSLSRNSGGRPSNSPSGRSVDGDSPFAGGVLSPDAMTEAMASVVAETDPIRRQRRFTQLLEALTPENAQAAVLALQAAPRSRWNWGQEYSLLTYAWGRLDGEAAVAFAKEKEGRSRGWTMASVLAGWASDQPERAMAWVEGLTDQKERSDFTRGLVSGLAQRDVQSATSYVVRLAEDGNERASEYMATIARHQLSQGVESAAEWSNTIPDGPLKGSALHTVASEYVRQNPEEAAAWVAQYAATDYATRAVSEVSEEWAEDDPAGAVSWVTTLPEGSSRSHAMGEAISEWAQKSPTEAGEFLGTLPQGDERDFAVSAFARRVGYEDPAVALDWAQSISSQEIRERTVTRNVRDWIRREPERAKTWVQNANLSEPVLEEIRRPQESSPSGYHRR